MKIISKQVLIVIAMILITGCSMNSADDPTNKDMVIKKAEKIEINDVFEGQYKDALRIELTEDEINSLKTAVGSADMLKETGGALPIYKLVIKDSDELLLDEWFVTTEREIMTSSNEITNDVNIQECLGAIEEKHDITYDSLMNRHPGEAYFKDLDGIFEAELVEITENNFVEGVTYSLDKKDIESIHKCADVKCDFDDKREEDIDVEATIRLYDKNESRIHTLDISHDGSIYCNGWRINGKEFTDTIKAIVKKSGLQEERNE